MKSKGFLGGANGKEPACQCRRTKRCGFNPWVRKTPWTRACQPTPVFLPGESPWTDDPGGLQSIGSQSVRHNWSDLAHMHTNRKITWPDLCHRMVPPETDRERIGGGKATDGRWLRRVGWARMTTFKVCAQSDPTVLSGWKSKQASRGLSQLSMKQVILINVFCVSIKDQTSAENQ